MSHFVLLSYFVSLIAGFITLGITGSIALRSREKTLYIYFLFYSAMTIDIFAETGHRYLLVNQPELLDSIRIQWLMIMNFCRFFVIFAIFVFSHYFTHRGIGKKNIKKIGLFSGLCFFLSVFFLFYPIEIRIFDSSPADLIYHSAVIYIILSGLYQILKPKEGERPHLGRQEYAYLRRIIILYSITILFVINDDISFINIPFRLSPFNFTALSIITFAHFYKYQLSRIRIDNPSASQDALFQKYQISEREKETVLLVLKGFSNKEISDELCVSLSTVKSHIYSVFKKTGVKNRFNLMSLFK